MDDYYVQQAGNGMGGFSGLRYQKGDGFFGRLISGSILPMIKKVLPYLGKTALGAAGEVWNDVSQGEKFKESLKNRLRSTAGKVGFDAMGKLREFTGSGRRRKRRVRSKKRAVRRKPKRSGKRKTKKGRKTSKTSRALDFL